jgi:protein-tyrosine-phosphatase
MRRCFVIQPFDKGRGQKTFSDPWYEDGYERQQEFVAAYRKVGELIRERIASLGILPQ